MSRLVTFALFYRTQHTLTRPFEDRPAAFQILRAELHETPGDCQPACRSYYAEGSPYAFPHVGTGNAALVTIVTPLCSAPWITAELAEWFETPEAPAFDFPSVYEHRAMVLNGHVRFTHPEHARLFRRAPQGIAEPVLAGVS